LGTTAARRDDRASRLAALCGSGGAGEGAERGGVDDLRAVAPVGVEPALPDREAVRCAEQVGMSSTVMPTRSTILKYEKSPRIMIFVALTTVELMVESSLTG
jgi:hypothetical protein